MLCCILLLIPTKTDQQIEYYSVKENYVTVTGRVYHIAYGPDKSYLYLAFSDKTVDFQDETFIIEGKNLDIIRQNGFDEKVSIGDEIQFVSATEIFWDSYSMPIVAMSVDGETVLDFETGYENLLASLREK